VVATELYAFNVKMELRDANSTGCAASTSCDSCTGDKSCVWCESDSTCKDGGMYGPQGEVFKGCADYRWGQCKVNGKVIFWGMISILALIVVGFIFCFLILSCYCSKKRKAAMYKKQKTWEQTKQDEMEKQLLSGHSKTPKTDSRRLEFYSKYGTPEEREAKKKEKGKKGSNQDSVFSL